MVILSTALISFNKWLMHSDRFPFAVPLVLIHMCFCSCFALLLRLVVPSLFPSLTSETERVAVDRDFFFKGLLPIGVVFAASLVLSNAAYTKLSLSFLQMIKETNLVWTYLFSLVFAVEVFKWTSVKLIIVSLVAMAITIKGELNFVFAGLAMQMGAIVCEALRIVLQALLLSGKKLDPLSYVLYISPICGVLLSFLAIALVYLPAEYAIEGMTMPSFAQLRLWAPWLIADSLLAFCLNVSVAALIKYSGPMTYLMCQLLKDVLAVLGGVLVLQEAVTYMQFVGFTMQILIVFLWSMAKTFPVAFESGLTPGVFFLLSDKGPFRVLANSHGNQPSKV